MEERNGKGKEYYDDDNIKFEGENLNGERNRKGKEYYDNGNAMYEGEFLNGRKKWEKEKNIMMMII